jgi:hypothetical protein
MRLDETAPLDPAKLKAADRALWERFPADFRRFYTKQNGGYIERDFRVPMTWSMHGKSRKVTTCTLDSFWRFDRKKREPHSILVEHFERHVDENFLPPDVYVFASTINDSLLAISLAEHDAGNIYYWEWYWQYPWYRDFFEKRVADAVKRFKAKQQDLHGRKLSAAHTVGDAANYGTLVKFAGSFSEFVKGLKPPADD